MNIQMEPYVSSKPKVRSTWNEIFLTVIFQIPNTAFLELMQRWRKLFPVFL